MDYNSLRDEEKNRRREKRQLEILVAADSLFVEQGIQKTKMTDIAKACQLGKASLYFYFKSKDEIVWQLLKQQSQTEHEAGKAYLDAIEGNGYEKLKNYLALFTDELITTYNTRNTTFIYRNHMSNCVAQGLLAEEMNEEYKTIVKRNLSTITSIIRIGIEDGSIRDLDSYNVLGQSIGIGFGAYFNYVVGMKGSFDDVYLSEMIKSFKVFSQLLLHGLKP